MLDPGDSKFPEHQPGIVLRAALIPRFGFFVAEAGPLTFSPAIEFGGSAEGAVGKGLSQHNSGNACAFGPDITMFSFVA
jgi:hypothetical protein